MSILLLYGPYESNGIVRHKIQRLYGLKKELDNLKMKYATIPIDKLNRLEIQMCKRIITTCDIRQLKFNMPAELDPCCQRLLNCIHEHTVLFANCISAHEAKKRSHTPLFSADDSDLETTTTHFSHVPDNTVVDDLESVEVPPPKARPTKSILKQRFKDVPSMLDLPIRPIAAPFEYNCNEESVLATESEFPAEVEAADEIDNSVSWYRSSYDPVSYYNTCHKRTCNMVQKPKGACQKILFEKKRKELELEQKDSEDVALLFKQFITYKTEFAKVFLKKYIEKVERTVRPRKKMARQENTDAKQTAHGAMDELIARVMAEAMEKETLKQTHEIERERAAEENTKLSLMLERSLKESVMTDSNLFNSIEVQSIEKVEVEERHSDEWKSKEQVQNEVVDVPKRITDGDMDRIAVKVIDNNETIAEKRAELDDEPDVISEILNIEYYADYDSLLSQDGNLMTVTPPTTLKSNYTGETITRRTTIIDRRSFGIFNDILVDSSSSDTSSNISILKSKFGSLNKI